MSSRPGEGSVKRLQGILEQIERSAGIRFERNRKGTIRSNAKSLEPHAACSPFIPLYLKAVKLRFYLANYLNKMTTPRLHPEYDYLLETGRVSNGGALATQTIPASGGIRECIIPAPGHVFVQIDVSQMELVMLGQASKTQFGYDSKGIVA